MRNRKLIRFQLFVLATLGAAIVVRVLVGPGDPVGLLVIADVDPGALKHASFRLDRTEPLIVEATGSLAVAVATEGGTTSVLGACTPR